MKKSQADNSAQPLPYRVTVVRASTLATSFARPTTSQAAIAVTKTKYNSVPVLRTWTTRALITTHSYINSISCVRTTRYAKI